MKREMLKIFRHTSTVKPGSSPGLIVDKAEALPTKIITYIYDHDSIETTEILPKPGEVGENKKVWISITGHADTKFFENLCNTFNIHKLEIEDVFNSIQLPKLEEYDDHLFIVTRVPLPDYKYQTEQVAIIVFDNLIITIHEWEATLFEPIRKRLYANKGRIRSNTGYLAYAFLDLCIDSYFPEIGKDAGIIDHLEETILAQPEYELGQQVIYFKKRLNLYRRMLSHTNELVSNILNGEYTQFHESNIPYLRDCEDHAHQAIEAIDYNVNHLTEIYNLQMSLINSKLNDIMKFLTIIATIFIPITFIAGIYGMNFNSSASPFNMPELNFYLGYPFALFLMVLTTLGLLFIFRYKGWIGKPRQKNEREIDDNDKKNTR